ncbi:heparin lyase I family protein [Chitinophaga sp. RAB17]|uniref:heparin lyase I family protein n=1 Tax=Chitinophaga sp. RAB17 TaxID=3233049 RepID=UPI003F8FFE70
MKKSVPFLNASKMAIISSLLATTACSKQMENSLSVKETTAGSHVAGQTTYSGGDTLLVVNYESGTINSGIPDLNTTNATATDASYIISPGRTGNYAIAHKVVLGDSAYFSDNHWRSESATANIPEGKHHPGDERRYEVSLLLKDWQPYVTGNSQAGDIIFQGKLGGGGNPAFYLMTKRNTIAFRAPNNDLQTTILSNYQPYINQWLDFRIDVLWADTATGYYKVYMRLPNQSDYSLIWEIHNFQTWLPDNPAAVSGYLKWGLYRPGESLANGDVPTRIIYHDDIRIIQLPLPQ